MPRYTTTRHGQGQGQGQGKTLTSTTTSASALRTRQKKREQERKRDQVLLSSRVLQGDEQQTVDDLTFPIQIPIQIQIQTCHASPKKAMVLAKHLDFFFLHNSIAHENQAGQRVESVNSIHDIFCETSATRVGIVSQLTASLEALWPSAMPEN